ncbi:hypothetical protein M5K25_007590 [Dendrobium thyrsiflorum]|uniref:Uncharacterized protein n=1 Tax=Dendrobium thyrsiflorum TaxID=117978 RepID=A0ABD0VF22_DENTH
MHRVFKLRTVRLFDNQLKQVGQFLSPTGSSPEDGPSISVSESDSTASHSSSVWQSSSSLLALLLSAAASERQVCMADPDVEHGFDYDEQGRTDILRSPFFDSRQCDCRRLHRPDPLVVDTIGRGAHPPKPLGDHRTSSTSSYAGYFSTNDGLWPPLPSGSLLPRMVLRSPLKPRETVQILGSALEHNLELYAWNMLFQTSRLDLAPRFPAEPWSVSCLSRSLCGWQQAISCS